MTAHVGGPETDEEVDARHARYLRLWQTGEAHMFAIVDEATGAGVGGCGWWHTTWNAENVCEAGWGVVPEAQGQGVATAALRLLIADARVGSDRRRLLAFPSVDNEPSNRLCAAVGFSLHGVDRFPFRGTTLTVNTWLLDLRATDERGRSR